MIRLQLFKIHATMASIPERSRGALPSRRAPLSRNLTPRSAMSLDVRKTLTDTGYIAVGLGVISVQQARLASRELGGRLGRTGDRLGEQARDLKTRLARRQQELETTARETRHHVEGRARSAMTRASELGTEVGKRVEPLVDQVLASIPIR